MSLEVDAAARRRPGPSGSVVEVDVHPPGECIGDDQRRRGEVVGPDLGVDAALEVAVAGEHGADDQVALRIACEIVSGSGPVLPMQVVQP